MANTSADSVLFPISGAFSFGKPFRFVKDDLVLNKMLVYINDTVVGEIALNPKKLVVAQTRSSRSNESIDDMMDISSVI